MSRRNIKKGSLSINKCIAYFVCILYLGSFYPAFWTSAIIGNASFVLHMFFLIAWAIAAKIVFKSKYTLLNPAFNKIYGTIVLYYVFRYILSFSNEYSIQIIRLIVFYLDIYVAYNSFKNKTSFMAFLIKLNVAMIILTIIGAGLFIMGMLQPVGIVNMSATGAKVLLNFGFFFLKIHGDSLVVEDEFVRPSGYYDEPGSFGLILVLLLVYNKMVLKSKKTELMLLFGGICTLSMAYIFSMLAYIVLFMMQRKYILPFVLSMGFVFAFTMYYEPGDGGFVDYVYMKTVGRTQNMVEGTDQSRDYGSSLKAFTDNMFIGDTTDNLDKKYPQATHETIWFFMAQNGIFGTFILFLPFIYLVLKRRKNIDLVKVLVLLGLNLGQRPDYFAPLYLTILYFSFFCLENKKVQHPYKQIVKEKKSTNNSLKYENTNC